MKSVVKSQPVIYPRSCSSLSGRFINLITQFPIHHPAYSAHTTVIQAVFSTTSSFLPPMFDFWPEFLFLLVWQFHQLIQPSSSSLYIYITVPTQYIHLANLSKYIIKVFPHPHSDIWHAHFNWHQIWDGMKTREEIILRKKKKKKHHDTDTTGSDESHRKRADVNFNLKV